MSEEKKRVNYYPFGLKHKGYNNVITSNGNSTAGKFGFGGKELQDDIVGGSSLDWYDVTARNYDPALGRWMNIDPLAEQMRRHSPYNYAFNNPIYFIDPDGMAPTDDYYNHKGEYLYTDTRTSNEIRLISQENFDNISTQFSSEIADKDSSYGNLLTALDNNSTIVENKITSTQLDNLWTNSNPEIAIGATDESGNIRKEQAGLIVLDVENSEIRLNVQDDSSNTYNKSANSVSKNADGTYNSGGNLVIGQIHTHPNEQGDGGKTFSRDPTKISTTGDRGVSNTLGVPIFQLDSKYLDVENGSKASSRNNISTNSAVRTGKFNLARQALKYLNNR